MKDFVKSELYDAEGNFYPNIPLPWYLDKKDMKRRWNTLRVLVQNICLKKNLYRLNSKEKIEKLMRKKKVSPLSKALVKLAYSVGVIKDMIDVYKLRAIIKLCLEEKPV